MRSESKHSLYPEEKPELCPNGSHASWRTLECDNKIDVIECSRCGKQTTAICDFDEEFD